MAVTAAVGTVVVGAAGVAANARQAQLAREKQGQIADDALRAQKDALDRVPKRPTAIANADDEIRRANQLAQTQGGSLLSDPVADRRSSREVGTVPTAGQSLLGG
jgi:chromosome condensin MukBEF ATPase and DNA-binding subunit MukB